MKPLFEKKFNPRLQIAMFALVTGLFAECTVKEGFVVFDEPFNNNSNGWNGGDWGNMKVEILGGFMSIEADESGIVLPNKSRIDSAKDYRLEAIIEKMSGDSLTYGIALNESLKNNLRHYFLISPSRSIVVCESSDDDSDYIYLPLDVDYAGDDIAADTFAIERRGSRTDFYLNRIKIGTSIIPVYGDLVEFHLYGAGNVRVHNLMISELPRQAKGAEETSTSESANSEVSVKTFDKDNYGVIVTYIAEGSEASEDWVFFADDLATEFKNVGIHTVENSGDSVIIDELNLNINLSEILAKNNPDNGPCYIFIEKGREPEYAPYAQAFETIARAKKFFDLPEGDDEH